MKREYDLIFSIGASCASSQALRHAGLQHLSLPFDWTGGPGLRDKADLICDNFSGWFDEDSFELVTVPRYGRERYWRDRRGFTPIHDLSASIPLADQLPAVREKYRRRVERFERLVANSRRVLAVQIDDPMFAGTSSDDMRYFVDALSAKWPGVTFEIVVLQDERGRSSAERIESSERGCRLVKFDIRRYDGNPLGVTDFVRVGDWLSSEYAVRDYRTAEERRQAGRKRRRAEYARFGAKNGLAYVWNRLEYKLYRHLKKTLAKRGLA